MNGMINPVRASHAAPLTVVTDGAACCDEHAAERAAAAKRSES